MLLLLKGFCAVFIAWKILSFFVVAQGMTGEFDLKLHCLSIFNFLCVSIRMRIYDNLVVVCLMVHIWLNEYLFELFLKCRLCIL